MADGYCEIAFRLFLGPGGLVFLFPSDNGFVGYYLFRCFYILLCEISPLQGYLIMFLIVS